MKTKMIEDKYKGQPMFQVWEVDEEGKVVGTRPIVSMGRKKLKAIMNHSEEAKKFIEEN